MLLHINLKMTYNSCGCKIRPYGNDYGRKYLNVDVYYFIKNVNAHIFEDDIESFGSEIFQFYQES